MKQKEFLKLLPAFEQAYEEQMEGRVKNNPNRKREPGGGGKPCLKGAADRLVFILLYFKQYPTQDLLGLLFGQTQPWAHKWIHRMAAPIKVPCVSKSVKVTGFRTPRSRS
jgi:hypothetical protein